MAIITASWSSRHFEFLVIFIIVIIGECWAEEESNTINLVGKDRRTSARLFSNPFGILGNGNCQTKLKGRDKVTGLCYNEVECLIRGGRFAGYCGPPNFIAGVCCVFETAKCTGIASERVSYYTNPSFPYHDNEPNSCLLRVRPIKNACWVRKYTSKSRDF